MTKLLVILLNVYRHLFGPVIHTLVPVRSGCRFPQTCSEYAIEMVRRDGALPGLRKAVVRLARCHSFLPALSPKL